MAACQGSDFGEPTTRGAKKLGIIPGGSYEISLTLLLLRGCVLDDSSRCGGDFIIEFRYKQDHDERDRKKWNIPGDLVETCPTSATQMPFPSTSNKIHQYLKKNIVSFVADFGLQEGVGDKLYLVGPATTSTEDKSPLWTSKI